MSKESEQFVKNMFKYFEANGVKERYLHYYPQQEFSEIFSPLASWLKNMDYVVYDSQNATITMTTTDGQIYGLDEIIEFNSKYSDDIEIIGIGNQVSAINHNAGGAVIQFQINIVKYENEIKKHGYNTDFEETEEEYEGIFSYL